MATNWTDDNLKIVDEPDVPRLPEGEVFSHILVFQESTGLGFLASVAQVQATVAPVLTTLPKPAKPTYADFSDTPAGGSVRLVPTDGVPMADYRYKVGSAGVYGPAPADGIINVDNITGSVYAFSVNTATRQQSDVAVSTSFTAYTAPTTGKATPAAPTFADFNDSQVGGVVRLVPSAGVPMADYLVKTGSDGVYAQAPGDGIINVGNIDGQVFAYSVETSTRNQSLTRASPLFTKYVAAPVNVSPVAPTFTDFDDVANTVTLVPPPGVPMTQLVVTGAGDSTFFPAPTGGMLSVGNVAGVVQAKSLAGGGFNASPVGTSSPFTVAGLPKPAAPTFVSYDTAGRTATVAPPAGYALADLRYTIQGGAAAAVPGTGKIPVGSAAVLPGQIEVFVFATSARQEGDHAQNEVGFPVTSPTTVTAYVGAFASEQPTAADFLAVTFQQWDKAARTIVVACNDQHPGFWEPQTQGNRTALQNGGGFDNTTSFNKYALPIGGVLGWAYVHNLSQFNDTFTEKLNAPV